MGHIVTGIIGSHRQLEEFARQKALPAPVPLVAGLALLPLRDEDMDSFLTPPLTGWHEEFASLTDQLMSELAKASRSGRVMYFETERGPLRELACHT